MRSRFWNKVRLKFYERPFYRPGTLKVGTGVIDHEKKVYQVQPSGALRRISPRRHEVTQSS